jgi:reverse transcriptase-like protein
MKSQVITSLTHKEVKRFFLKETSYVNFELPYYFHFDQLLALVNAEVGSKDIAALCKQDARHKPIYPSSSEGVNYTILSNKDGAYSWRPLQIIHPVLYIELVNLITREDNWKIIVDRFSAFGQSCVTCISMPRESLSDESDKAAQISNWWEKIEQQSLKMALEFDYIYSTDISDCYASIYTHSVEWALHENGRAGVKTERATGTGALSLGRQIDMRLQGMNNGQTNGIPQGSVISDFLAELVLGYSDLELTARLDAASIPRNDYRILRYRDDYRILTNDPPTGHKILKELNTVLYDLGLKMHPGKTKGSDDVILASLKPEKLEYIATAPAVQHFQKEALRIYQLSKKYPNSGIILKELQNYYTRLDNKKRIANVDYRVLISIFAMIPIHSPRSMNICAAVLSKLMERTDNTKHVKLTEMIIKKFESLPNVSFIEIWLQRIAAPLKVSHVFTDPLTEVALSHIDNIRLWESSWLLDDAVRTINAADLSNLAFELENETISPTISKEEVQTFRSHGYDW